MYEATTRKMGELFRAERFEVARRLADETLNATRSHPCWSAALLLQNTGLVLLRVLTRDPRRRNNHAWAERTLLHAQEALASAVRYAQGTWQERTRRADFPQWIAHALGQRQADGLRPLTGSPSTSLPLRHGMTLLPAGLTLLEPEVDPPLEKRTPVDLNAACEAGET